MRLLIILLTISGVLYSKSSKYRLNELEYIGFNPIDPLSTEGLESILRGDEYQYGIPEKVFKLNFSRFSKNKLWELGNIPSPSSDAYLTEFRRDVGKFKKLPLGLSSFERDGEKLVNTNCFSCHAGVVAGKVIAGMPSTNFDPHNQIVQTDLLDKLYSNPDSFFQKLGRKVLLNKVQDRALKGFMDYYKKIVKKASRATLIRGDNSGPWVVWYTLAKMSDVESGLKVDLDLMSEFEQTVLDLIQLPNVNPSPWWNLKYKERSFWLADVSHHSATTFSLNLLDQHPNNIDTMDERLERTEKHLTYARNIKSPEYPYEIDFQKAARGREIFMGAKGRCYKCHGEYDESGELVYFPERSPRDVKTDPAYALAVSKMSKMVEKAQDIFKDKLEWYAAGEETVARKVNKVGYAPPPLKGIWASAPYFHNGSVPTLEAVLNSKKRPAIWQMNIDPFAYNQNEVGLVYKEVQNQEYEEMKNKHKTNSLREKHLIYRRIYNTQEFGRSNRGHTKGDHLSDSERADLIEFLKML